MEKCGGKWTLVPRMLTRQREGGYVCLRVGIKKVGWGRGGWLVRCGTHQERSGHS